MTNLALLQQQFIDVIKGNEPTNFANAIITQGSVNTITRIEIYCNAYFLRLKECIETDHEILGFFLGDDLFNEMVAGYIDKYPSQQISLRYFCDQLPSYLAEFSPFKEHLVISELACFERHLLTAFDAEDAPLATVTMLQQIAPEDWPRLVFNLHPSVQLFSANFNSVEIWQSLKKNDVPPVVENQKNSWLIWRNAERLTEFFSLDISEYIMLKGLINGESYAVLCEQLTEFLEDDEIGEKTVPCLVNWLNYGIIKSLSMSK